MSKVVRRRRWIALAAAYLVALQALLLPLTVAAFAAPDSGLCLSAPGEGPHQPAGHDTSCPCAAGCGMQCCASAFAGPPQQVNLAVPPTQASAIAAAATQAKMHRPAERGPHGARAPPSA